MNFDLYQQQCLARVEAFLTRLLPPEPVPPPTSAPLYKAIRYCVLGAGKRIRPLLVYATGEAFGISPAQLDAPAAAIELIHCYSLIHDDLPAMDNDDLRRGKPSCHKAFDEATAILAGDALQALAFEVLADPVLNPIPAEPTLKMLRLLAHNSGMAGMVGGQALDLAFEGSELIIPIEHLRTLHQKKTGALIEAAVLLGALAAYTLDTEQQLALQTYARCIGLAYQIQDDILDITCPTERLGKTAGKDQQQGKATFPSRLGIETAKEYANALHQEALENIEFLKDTNHALLALSTQLMQRDI